MKKILLSIFCCMLAVIGLQAQSYVKVTTAPADWEGDYLIVYETNSVAFNGGLSTLDATSNTIGVTIVDNEIAATDATNAAKFTIEAVSGGYAIKSASGKYIGVSSNSNGLKTTTTSTTYKHSLSIDASADAVIKAEFSSSTMALRFNKASDQNRFRYYKNAGQQAIQLYKYTEGTGGGEEDTTPAMSADVDALAFKAALNTTTDAQTVTLTVKNLDAVTYTCSNAAFGVTDNGDNTYDVTFTAPAEVGTTNGTLTFSADGVDDVVVNLTGVATNEVTIWEEDFTDDTTPYALTYTNGGTTTKIYNETNAGGTSPELLISKTNGAMSVDITDLKGCSGDLTLTFLSNYYSRVTVSTTTDGVVITENSDGNYTVTVPSGVASLNLTFTNTSGSNTRVDDFLLVGAPSTPDPEDVAVPTFDPVSGTVVKMGTVVTITSAEGTTLWYTVNGGADNETDTNTATITINEETTIEAAAVKGENMSDVVTATYTIAQLPDPTFDPAPGAVFAGTVVTISTVEGAEMAYSVNGDVFVAETSATVTINEDTEIEVFASMDGYIASETVTVNYTIKEPAAAGEYELVTDASILKAGDKIIIAAADYGFAISTTQNKNNRGQAEVIKSSDKTTVTFGEDVQVIELQAGSVEGTFAFYVTNYIDVDNDNAVVDAGYLYASSSSSNQLKTQDEIKENGSWLITITDGVASIVAQREGRNTLRYNSSNNPPIFSCYDAENSQKDIVVYRMVPYAENIESGKCYSLAVGNVWDEPEGCWYAAKFINKNTDAYTWSAVASQDATYNGYIFYLAPGNTPIMRAKAEGEGYKYTHVEFVQLPASVDVPDPINNLDLTGVDYKTTGEIFYDGTSSTTYDLATTTWKDVATGVEVVENANGIVYANNVVYAEGVIEVYNLSGAVVAYGENRVDLNALAGGVYVVRCGNDVMKVVR